MEWYIKVLKQFNDFKTRARRKEYWMWTLYVTLINILAMILDDMLGLNFELLGQDLDYGWLYLITGIINFIPGLSIVVRRLHDVGKSGWFFLIILIPIIGWIGILILLCSDGDKEENKWGTNPKIIN